MAIFLTVIHVIVALFLVLVVLLQSGRGGGMGAAFGGASGQIFGGRGAAPFLAKVTTGAAVVFFLTSMSLSAISSKRRSVLLGGEARTQAEADTTGEAASVGEETPAHGPATQGNDAAAPAAPLEDAGSDDMKAEQQPTRTNGAQTP